MAREGDHIVAEHWGPRPGDGDLIWAHLLRQRDLDPRHHVRLDDGTVVRVGADAEGEGDT